MALLEVQSSVDAARFYSRADFETSVDIATEPFILSARRPPRAMFRTIQCVRPAALCGFQSPA